VCISFSDGSGGHDVARLVARELDFRLVDEEIVLRAAEHAGISAEVVADVERRKSLLERIVRQLNSVDAGAAAIGFVPASGQVLGVGAEPHPDDLRDLVKAAIEATADEGNAVIAAHAASVALADRRRCVRALVTASTGTRASRVARSENVGDRDAARLVEKGDAGRRDYFKRFYAERDERPTFYDLVVNTDRIGEDDAASLIVTAARSA
jgi:cytidylate kinase